MYCSKNSFYYKILQKNFKYYKFTKYLYLSIETIILKTKFGRHDTVANGLFVGLQANERILKLIRNCFSKALWCTNQHNVTVSSFATKTDWRISSNEKMSKDDDTVLQARP